MTDEGKAGICIALWSIAFHAGVFVAAGVSKPVGLMLMGCATAILVATLRADGRVEAERRRRLRYQQDCERRTEEAMKNDED